MQAKNLSHSRKRFLQFTVGGIVLLILGLCVFSFVLQQREAAWNKQLATLIATDSRIAAFGDEAHAVPITPEAVLAIGESAILDELQVSVTKSAETKDIVQEDPTPSGFLYWRVDFTVKNLSGEQIYPHPIVDSQMQYLVNGHYRWQPNQWGDCIPSLKEGVPALEPSGKFDCSLIYLVPSDSQPLYWIYLGIDHEQFAVFQVR